MRCDGVIANGGATGAGGADIVIGQPVQAVIAETLGMGWLLSVRALRLPILSKL